MENSMAAPQKLKIELPYYPAIPLLGIYPEKTIIQKDTEDVVHIYNGILLSHKKERNSAISRDVDRPRDCHTE